MSTGQKYPKGAKTPNNFEPSVQRLTKVAVDDFVTQFARLIEQKRYPEDFYKQLTDSLRLDGIQRKAITYTSILDGLHLFRSVMHPIVEQMGDYHAAALIRDGGIIELVLINWDEQGFGSGISPQQLNSQYLMDRVIATKARSVLMISARSTYDLKFSPVDTTYVDGLSKTLSAVDVELIDWVLMNRERNLSHEQLQGWDYSQDGISPDEVRTAGIKYVS